MTNSMYLKSNVTVLFETPDGGTAKRSLMEDFKTLGSRIFIRILKITGDEVGSSVLLPGVNAYNIAEYENALSHFVEAISIFPELMNELLPHVQICRKVIATERSSDDRLHLEQLRKYEASSRLGKLFLKNPVTKVRCKYCGHFTPYIDPNYGFAYLDTNNCLVCSRGYPVPDFAWDGIDGKAYIYYRNSVTEPQFYTEFEALYEVHQDHKYFLGKAPTP
jgi:hypothetical protein